MAAGDITQGRRLPDRSVDAVMRDDFEPGDYCLIDGVVWAREPGDKGGALMALTEWKITEEEDGTLSLSPSIWVNKHHNPPGWHGYLEHGKWREV